MDLFASKIARGLSPLITYRDLSIGLGAMPRRLPIESGWGVALIGVTIIAVIGSCWAFQDPNMKQFHPFEKNKLS